METQLWVTSTDWAIKFNGNLVRYCARCRQVWIGHSAEGYAPDPCLGQLSGVCFACCGHGGPSGYISFDSGQIIRFPTIATEHQGRFNTVPDLGPSVMKDWFSLYGERVPTTGYLKVEE